MARKTLEYLHKLWYSILKIKSGAKNMKNKAINRDIIENSYYMINLFDEGKKQKDISITNLKLQKLMYFLEAYYTVENPEEEELFNSEWSAWDYGPVNRELYNHYRKFGSMEITLNAIESEKGKDLPEINKKYIKKIYDLFGGFSAFDLVTLTHLDGSPWDKLYKNNEKLNRYDFGKLNDSIISKKETKEWFKNKFDFLFKNSRETENNGNIR